MKILGFMLRKPTWIDLIFAVVIMALGAWACSVSVDWFGANPTMVFALLTGAFGALVGSSFGISVRENGWPSIVISVLFGMLAITVAVWIGWLPR